MLRLFVSFTCSSFFKFGRLLRLFVVANLFGLSLCIPPIYTPALLNNVLDRDGLVGNYFNLGFTYKEIVGFLALQHGISACTRTVRRILKRLNLTRANNISEAPLDQVLSAVLEELDNSCGSFLGYRRLTARLREKYQLLVRRDTVMRVLRVVDPEGVDCRRRSRLKRRRYITPGPNYIWHVDGWDKLAPFGFFIHGTIDGYSRRILWLEVNSTNKNPRVIANHYLATVGQLKGVPQRIRSDLGTENTNISFLQKYFRWQDNDNHAGPQSFVQGKSSANQRIEAWWSKFRDGGGGWWLNVFKDLRDSGLYTGDSLATSCLKFCFLPILRQELQLVAKLWNTHNIQSQRGGEI